MVCRTTRCIQYNKFPESVANDAPTCDTPPLRDLCTYPACDAGAGTDAGGGGHSFTPLHPPQHTPALLHYRTHVASWFGSCTRNG